MQSLSFFNGFSLSRNKPVNIIYISKEKHFPLLNFQMTKNILSVLHELIYKNRGKHDPLVG